ncbi:hypothetical protein KW797_01560 [Candidatus Parcubacteria bacterium]|nr:hypothetical protein [Candidatus Parcubacteria bacterium]
MKNISIWVAVVVLAILAVWGAGNMRENDFTLKNLGVAINADGLPPSLTYDPGTMPGVGPVAFITTGEIKASAADCYLGSFYRISKDSLMQGTHKTRWTTESLLAQVNPTSSPATVKEFEDFFLVFEPSQSVCSGNSDEPRLREQVWLKVPTAKLTNSK